MDIDFVDPLQKIREVQVKIPTEIQEITSRLDGPFNCPEYSEDIYEYLQVWTNCSLCIIHCFFYMDLNYGKRIESEVPGISDFDLI